MCNLAVADYTGCRFISFYWQTLRLYNKIIFLKHFQKLIRISSISQVLEWLLENGAKIMTDNLGGSPLHDAAEHGRLHVSSNSVHVVRNV